MSGPLDIAIERGWHEAAAVAGVLVTVTLVNAGAYDSSTGEQASGDLAAGRLALTGPATWRQIESGAASRADRFIQVCASDLPRLLRADDLVALPDGSMWKVRSTVEYGAIIEAIIGRA